MKEKSEVLVVQLVKLDIVKLDNIIPDVSRNCTYSSEEVESHLLSYMRTREKLNVKVKPEDILVPDLKEETGDIRINTHFKPIIREEIKGSYDLYDCVKQEECSKYYTQNLVEFEQTAYIKNDVEDSSYVQIKEELIVPEEYKFEDTKYDIDITQHKVESSGDNDYRASSACGDSISETCSTEEFSMLYRDFKKHLNIFHKGTKVSECSECEKMLSNLVDLNIKIANEGITNSKCNENPDIISQENSLKSHINNMYKRIKKLNSQCQKVFSLEENIIIKNYNCYGCDKVFSHVKSLKIHVNRVHKRFKNHKCSECGRIFSRATLVENHFNSVHKGIKNNKSIECNKMFSKARYVKDHIKTVHKRIKSYKCNLCNKMFSTASSLKVHISSVHKLVKDCKCNECHKMFSQSGYLKVHINTVHRKIKKHECSECDRSFSQKLSLKFHINSVHKKIKKYKCTECHKMFPHPEYLRIHNNSVHRKIKNYKCCECHKMFSQKQNLQIHIHSVHKP